MKLHVCFSSTIFRCRKLKMIRKKLFRIRFSTNPKKSITMSRQKSWSEFDSLHMFKIHVFCDLVKCAILVTTSAKPHMDSLGKSTVCSCRWNFTHVLVRRSSDVESRQWFRVARHKKKLVQNSILYTSENFKILVMFQMLLSWVGSTRLICFDGMSLSGEKYYW